MNKADKYYIKNLKKILKKGSFDENPRPKYKDGSPANSKFITQVFEKYDISKNEFPITTLRNTAIKTGIKELLWIYQSQDNSLISARENGIFWWDEWDVGDNTIGQRYGATVSRYDLMNKLLDGLKNDPFSRRHIINLYQEKDLNETDGLFPCAYETIWSVRKVKNEYYLDMTLIQRSNDYVMAGIINKIQYTAFLMMVAGHLNYKVGKFCHLVQNLHIYNKHYDAVNEILNKEIINIQPRLELVGSKNFYDYTIDDFIIHDNIGEKLISKLELAI
jgi:thymidylate synthase